MGEPIQHRRARSNPATRRFIAITWNNAILAASAMDRRLSTVCGFYRLAHIDRRIKSNLAQYLRRPQVHPSQGHRLDRTELGKFLFSAGCVSTQRAALAVLLGLTGLRESEACGRKIEDLASVAGIAPCRSKAKATSPQRSLARRVARTIPDVD